MKANELMIGDWVYNAHHKKCIMITAYDFFTHHHNNDGTQSFLGIIEPMPTRCFDLAGIPLTEEILKANEEKLKANGVSYGDCHMEETKWFCYIKDTDVYCYELQWKFNYVHELQHALRLCGLSDLADNFKLQA